MRTRITLFLSCLLALLAFNPSYAQEVTPEHKDSLNAMVDAYYQINVRIFQEGSTIDDIAEIFALFTDDFEYIHPRYGGTYSRQVLYDGYARNQRNGGYDGSVVDIKVLTRIVGLNAVVTQKVFMQKEVEEIVAGEPQMTLFEFRDGKISRIREYW
jgi:hypothetical protein